MATKSQQAYGLIHTARFGNHAANIEPLEFVRPLSEICLRSRPAVLSLRAGKVGGSGADWVCGNLGCWRVRFRLGVHETLNPQP